ncbi:MAG: tRNA preQ1(34) S-adenosylmethionine ribosyltransferase-isomerase QueA [Candidatus Edwardsbacteria bacterium]|nr:tRNA preQ1(34) S-adenosylmethionine ribosyltransferase-isomerase QueA [Candidatus Edwardsbacteria bacterium]
MRLADFDYALPPELIAQRPAEPRDSSRLLVLSRDSGAVEHRAFRDIADYLRPSDLLVINTTKVVPARLLGRKRGSGAAAEIFLLRRMEDGRWSCLVRPGRRLRPGSEVELGDGRLVARIAEYQDQGRRVAEFRHDGAAVAPDGFVGLLERYGHTPLPPYIARQDGPADRQRYQTVYARQPGAVAAPTAGLHFTPGLLDVLRAKGIVVAEVLLHVGWGTFKSVEAEDIRRHRMDEEFYRIGPETTALLRRARAEGRRIIAVGTTTVRALESHAASGSTEDWTGIFIHPPYGFRMVDGLVTNFHLPKSTLLMLVSAFAGVENVRNAYAEAVRERYRFYSYGDAMLII